MPRKESVFIHAEGQTAISAPGTRLHYDPQYCAANVFDPDGFSLEAVNKNSQHPQTA